MPAIFDTLNDVADGSDRLAMVGAERTKLAGLTIGTATGQLHANGSNTLTAGGASFSASVTVSSGDLSVSNGSLRSAYGLTAAGALTWGYTNQGTQFGSSMTVRWYPGDLYTTPDSGIARDSAGVLRVTNGSTGTGDLKLGNATVAGTTTATGRIVANGAIKHAVYTVGTVPTATSAWTDVEISVSNARNPDETTTGSGTGKLFRCTGTRWLDGVGNPPVA